MKHFISSLSVINANTPPCKGRVSSRKFLSLLLILFLGVGNAWGETVTLNNLGTGLSSTSNSSLSTTKVGDYTLNYLQGKKQGNSILLAKGTNGGTSFISNKTPIPGAIKSVTVYINSGAAAKTTYHCAFSTTECTSKYATGSTAVNITGGNSNKYTCSVANASYFCISLGNNNNGQVLKLEIEYTPTSSGGTEPVLSSIEISGDLTKKTYEEGEELDLAGLTVLASYESGDPKDVTNDVEWSYTPNPLTKGTTSVEVTATYEDKTATTTITGLTVNEHIIIPSEYCITPNNDFWGTNYTGTDAAAATTLSGKQNDINILHARNTSGSLYVNDTQTRAYAGHTMKISVPSGYVITSIAFTKGTSWEGTLSADCGTINNTNWTGTNQNVIITFNNGKCFITKICVTYIKDVKYALTITEPAAGTGTLVVKDGENALTSGAEIYEGTKLTVTATPETGYEEGVVVVKNTSDEVVTATVYADGVLTMPAYAVTISATFEKKPCELLAKPTVSAETTYNSATLSWGAVTNAAKYSVKIGSTDAVETTETSYEVTGLTAETEYAYQIQAIAEAGQDTYCDSEVAEGTFATAKAPTATLTLKDIVGEKTQTGALNGTITLPTTAAECSKTFVGWSAVEILEPGEKPATNFYASGAEYTFTTLEPTLYAVYADGESGEASLTKMTSSDALANGDKIVIVANGTKLGMYQETISTSYVKNWELGVEVPTISELDEKKIWDVVVVDGSWKLGDATNGYLYNSSSNNLAVSTAEASTWTIAWKTTGFTFKSDQNRYLACRTDLTTDKKNLYRMNGTSVSSTNGSVYEMDIYKYSVSAPTYSNYSTTCAAALAAPTFSVAEGTYTEAKSIELSATEGDIYYTLDGTEPTELSTPYTAAINLDECGTTTIKAIAISTERKSSAASATYIINLPITNTAATAYTPTEATAIIDGACDKSEEVYVKGVVVSTSEFNATYGNYDVIVKAVDDNSATPTTFTFYRMYKAASNTKFTESDEVIGVGDIITAKGVLKKHNSTYELAEGCYMVERVAFTEPKTDISNTEATAYTVDKAFELISDVKSDLDKEVYVKGLVAVGSTELYEEKYLTYSISDNGQTTGNVLKVYDGLDIGGVAFASKDDVKVGDYVVVKGKLLNYKGTYEINKDNQLIEHISAATITIADITMEVGETKTIAATVVPAEAEVTYTIKENAANAISLSGNVITANTVGSATITATIATAADYMGKTIDFTVTVNAKSTKEKVVILAQYEGQWYAMKAQYVTGKTSHLAPLPVTYFDGKLYNVNEADKALIEWERAMVDGKATFYNDGKYLTGKSDKTDLTLAATTCEWTISEDSYLIGARTFLYNAENNWFRNFGTSNAGDKNYSDMPTVTAPVYATGDIVYTRTATPGSFSTICLPYAGTISGATLFDLSDRDETYVYVVEAGTELEAGKPYVILPTANEIVVTCKNYDYVAAGSNNALYGTYDDMNSDELDGKYVITGNKYYYVHKVQSAGSKLLAYRAYFNLNELPTAPASAPGVRRIALGTNGQNTATSMENVDASAQPVKMIINGQLFILRGEKMYDAQGKLAK